MRVGALQDWPELVHMPARSRVMTSSKSASSRMMFADLPPSSCATRFTVGAALRATSMPARVEPVNDTMSTSGCDASGTPTLTPSPFTRLNTPAGTPAASRISAKMIAFSGATSDGLSTIVQPAASAGATLHAIWFSGQFQGVIIPHDADRLADEQRGAQRRSRTRSRRAPRARWRGAPTRPAACAACASHSGAPTSWLMMSASSSMRAP